MGVKCLFYGTAVISVLGETTESAFPPKTQEHVAQVYIGWKLID